MTKLRIVCVAFSEMGHFMPMSHVACALIEQGHEVFFITNEDKYNGNKSSKVLTSIGCINQIYTVEGITREMMFPDRREGTKDPFE